MITCLIIVFVILPAIVAFFIVAAKSGTRDWTAERWEKAYEIHAKIAAENSR